MSVEYWGVAMYGVMERSLKFKEEYCDGLYYISEDYFNGSREFPVTLPNGKEVRLWLEVVGEEEASYFRFNAGYPWEPRMAGLTEKDIRDAIVQFLRPYLDMTDDDIYNEIDYISAYNCC